LGVTLFEEDGTVSVSRVAPGSPAEKAGIRPGDQLLKIDDDQVRSAEDAVEDIRDKDPGSRVSLQIRRDGRTQELRAKLVSRERAFERLAGQSSNDQLKNRTSRDENYREGNQDNLAAQVRSLQQQIAQLRSEVQQLRQQQSGSSESGYRGQTFTDSTGGPNRSGSTSGDSSSDNQNSQDRNSK